MIKKIILSAILLVGFSMFAQETNPVITSWLQNTTGITGRHYVAGNSTPVTDAVQANVQTVQYNSTNVYVSATGIPAYITGPFQGNPTTGAPTPQNKTFKFSLNPQKNNSTLFPTTGGNIGVFKNGVALFDYRDGVAWNNTTNTLCGGPMNSPCPEGGPGTVQAWNRDAIPAEMNGFDCAKAHPANGNYHHHQNPSAFKLDLNVLSTICSTYPSDGLYVIDPSVHSPLLGFAYDGFPIYGAYAYANTDGTGAIARMKSSYQLRTNTTRVNGPAINQVVGTQTFFNGYFREDYEYVAHTGDTTYLDSHNGRVCNTPEYPASLYPKGIFCYFTTVDANHNSAYPYVVGPKFYGEKVVTNPGTVPAGSTLYNPQLSTNDFTVSKLDFKVYPNPTSDLISIQSTSLLTNDLKVEMIDELGKIVMTRIFNQGSSTCYFETDTIYNGVYFLKISDGLNYKTYKVLINK